jgi:DNA-binding beta-propeller fold protein YncE
MRDGIFMVIDAQKAIESSSLSVLGATRSGCFPGQMKISPDGRTVYQVAGGDDALLAFDVGTPSAPRMIGKVPVGASPIGIAIDPAGARIFVANSDQFDHPAQPQTVSVIDGSRLADGKAAVIGVISTGPQPRQLHLTGDGQTLLVGNNGTPSSLQVIDLARMIPASQSSKPQAAASSSRDSLKVPVEFDLPGVPRHVLSSANSNLLFVRVDSFNDGKNKGVTDGFAVLRVEGDAIQQIRYLAVPGIHDTMAFTPNQKMLLVKADQQIGVIDVEALVSGKDNPVLGYIASNRFSNKGGPQTGPLPISHDGKYLFVSQHSLDWISIIDLEKVEAGHFGADAIAGGFATPPFPSGIVVSPDGKHLFFASSAPSSSTPAACPAYGSTTADTSRVATLSVINVVEIQKALSDPDSAVVSSLPTRCHAPSLVSSPDGATLYTASHTENVMIAIDVRPLLDGGSSFRILGTAPVGTAPRDVLIVDGGRKIIVANSNQMLGQFSGTETLTVIDAAGIGTGRNAVLGTIAVGADPRYLSLTADGRKLVVSNFKSRSIQLFDLEQLPLQSAKP